MPAQVYDRTWLHSTNNTRTPATQLEASQYTLWSMCSAMVGGTFGGFGASAGKWALYASSNSLTAGTDSTDRLHLLSGGFTAGDWVRAAAGVAHSWCVLSRVINGFTFYLLVSFVGASDLNAALSLSKVAPSAGTITADPTAFDSWNFSSTAAIPINSGAAAQTYFNASLSTSGDFIFTTLSPSKYAVTTPFIFSMAVMGPVGCHSLDLYPIWQYASLTTKGFDGSVLSTSGGIPTRNGIGAVASIVVPMNCGNWLITGNASGDALTGSIPDVPAWLGVVGGGFHLRGRLPDIAVSGRNTGTNPPWAPGRTIRDAGSIIRYQTCAGVTVPADTAFLLV